MIAQLSTSHRHRVTTTRLRNSDRSWKPMNSQRLLPSKHSLLKKIAQMLVAIVLMLSFGILSSNVYAGTCTVDDNGPADYVTIQAAIDDSNCEPIAIAAGTYIENLIITRAVTLQGADSTTTLIDGNMLSHVIDIMVLGGPEVTITDLTIQNGRADKGAGIYAGTSVTLNNVVITQNIATDYGGGIYVSDGPLILDNSIIIDNEAGLGGGGIDNRFDSVISNSEILNNRTTSPNINQGGAGIHNRSNLIISDSSIIGNISAWVGGGITNDTYSPDALTLTNVIIEGNVAPYVGGGIFNWSDDSVMVIDGSQITNNATTDNVGSGGGIKNEGIATITASTISDNTSVYTGGGIEQRGSMTLIDTDIISNSVNGGRGGGIFLGDGSLELIESRVELNSAERGGGIYTGGWTAGPGTQLTLNNTTVKGNIADIDGGGILNSVIMNLTGSTISGNTAGINGGGITDSNLTTLTTISNSTISNNIASNGAGIYVSGDMNLNNSTISSNTADAFSVGGIKVGFSSVITVRNSIIAMQTVGYDCSSAVNSIGYNLESGSLCGFTAIGDQQNTDPLLLPLSNNGGLTETLALSATSPAIDTADPMGCMADLDGDAIAETQLLVDQRGQARVDVFAVGNEAPEEFCDIGAYEYEFAPLPLIFNPSFEDDSDLDGLPDLWTYRNFNGVDGQDCTQAYSGACSLMIDGNGLLKKSKQIVYQAGLAGDSYTFSLRSKTDNATTGRLRAAIRVKHSDGTSMYVFINLEKGSHDWQEYSIPFVAASDYDSIVVFPMISQLASGFASVDSVNLIQN